MGGLLRGGVRLIDRLLSKSSRIIHISQDPDCILRIQLGMASHTVTLGGERLAKGEPVLALHVDNQRMPGLSPGGASLEWGLELRRRLVYSFKLVAKVMQSDKRYSNARAIYGASALFSFTDHTGGLRMIQHLGFTVLPCHRPLGAFGEFWENLFSWWLMWAYNPPSLKSRRFWRLQRTEIWMTTAEFFRRYGEPQSS